MSVTLGISAFGHDSSAALVVDGQLVAAVQEERLSRVKLDGRFPAAAIRACLERAGQPRVDRVAFHERPLPTLDRVLEIRVPFETILTRMTSRRVCAHCGAVYNLRSQPPKVDGICDRCGRAEVVQREDDSEETVRHRLQIYETSTAPLVEYYERRGLLSVVEGDKAPQDVFSEIVQVLEDSGNAL